ncbi:MAG: ATP synthase F1 subunit delta [Deltaproteobacteria bacterium]|nr:ATP synthase F1 subunit delta [Deltaproteobacteria bacterium]
MLNNKIAKRYAGALFEVARESGRTEEIYKELNGFIAFCDNETGLKEFLPQTFIDKKKRREVVSLLGEKLSLSTEFISFICLLIENERTRYLLKILQEFTRLRNDFLEILTVNVVSAKKLKDGEIKKIKNMIEKATGKSVVISEKISAEIIGGYIINVDGKLYNGSIKTQLENLYNYLKQGASVYGG